MESKFSNLMATTIASKNKRVYVDEIIIFKSGMFFEISFRGVGTREATWF